jgi:ankyrin repeat protein
MAEITPTEQFIAVAAAGDVESLRAMLAAQPDLVNARSPAGEGVIHAAHYAGHTEVAALLYAHGVQRDIFLAAELGLIEDIVAALTADSAAVHAQRAGGATALRMAVFWGHPVVAELLLDNGADVNLPSGQSMFSPMHSAVAAPTPYCPGDDEGVVLATVELLLDRGGDANARSRIGATPLFTAAANGDLRVVRRLMAAGPDPRVVTIDYDGPYANLRADEIATARGHAAVVAYLAPLVSGGG